MIDISFLKSPLSPAIKMGGLEFLDWQNKSTFYEDLVAACKEAFVPADGVFIFSKGIREKIEQIIKTHSNLKVSIVNDENGNLAIDAGYINPGNLLNSKGIEKWFSKDYSRFGEAFKDLKKDVITGWCNTRTGRVEGDYGNIPFTIYINPNFSLIMDEKVLLKQGITHYEAYAAFILHECGHAYGGLYFVSQNVIDNVLITKAAKMYSNASDDAVRATILKEASEALEVKAEKINDALTEEAVVILFSKSVANRNFRRCLSIGVETMTSEVLADAYAIRFGASRSIVGALASLPFVSIKSTLKFTLCISLIVSFFAGVPLIPFFTVYSLIALFINGITELTPGVYDTPYRRIQNVVRENINRVNSSNMSGGDKAKALKAIRDLDAMAEERKPFFEATSVQRAIGWICSGSDFRKTDFENYVADLTSTTLALYNSDYFTKG